jgi:hypothetical protein
MKYWSRSLIQFELPMFHDFYSHNPQLFGNVINMSKSFLFEVITCIFWPLYTYYNLAPNKISSDPNSIYFSTLSTTTRRGRGPLYTRAWGPLTHELDLQIMWLVEKFEMVKVHFTLDLEGLSDQRIWAEEKSTWHLHGNKWTMSHSQPILPHGHQREVGLM